MALHGNLSLLSNAYAEPLIKGAPSSAQSFSNNNINLNMQHNVNWEVEQGIHHPRDATVVILCVVKPFWYYDGQQGQLGHITCNCGVQRMQRRNHYDAHKLDKSPLE